MSDYQVLARKYRPKKFADVLGQEAIVQTLKNSLLHKKMAHAYLFAGPRGTGKTTLARLLAKALNCSAPQDQEPCNTCQSCTEISTSSSIDVLEIDGASHRGIDDIRSITETVGYAPLQGRYKVYIIDEVHMLTKEAFNALLKTLEEPPPHVLFFFATTELHKIPQTILSRCQRFNVRPIPQSLIAKKLRHIADAQSIRVEEPALYTIAQHAGGGLRDAESLFDQIITFSDGHVTAALVHEILGTLPQAWFLSLDEAVASGNIAMAFNISHEVFSQGKDASHFLDTLLAHYRSLLLIQLSCQNLIEPIDTETLEALQRSSTLYTKEQCMTSMEWIVTAQQALKTTLSERALIESLLLKLIRIRLRIPIEHITARLVELEGKVAAAPAVPAQASFSRQPEMPQEVVPENDPQKKARHDTLIQFAAVALKGGKK